MKTLIAALALLTLASGPVFDISATYGGNATRNTEQVGRRDEKALARDNSSTAILLARPLDEVDEYLEYF